ncbi:MAG: ABC transporter C-terminal domain-containing protein [Bacteroidota bacterium]
MSNEVINTLILAAFLAATSGAGYYVTQNQQPAEIEALDAEIDAIENRAAELETLIQDEAVASEDAALALQRWNSRYKVLPAELASADVVAYLNALSSRGFRTFDLSFVGIQPASTAQYYTYRITGQAYFESLFSFIWNVENNRALYRVRELNVSKLVTQIDDSGVDRQVVLAEFTMEVDAFFGGPREVSAPDSMKVLPAEAFPPRSAAINPFYPYILESLPPNSDDLVEVDTDSLMAVIGGTAVFMREGEPRQLSAGSRVYLGRVSSVDPRTARVIVDLNKGGIRERVEIDLNTGERFRQAIGGSTLARGPVRGPTIEDAPPAPGTPDAEGHPLYESAEIPRMPQDN